MYQHDVPVKRLESSLDDIVCECVSFVGVDLNTCPLHVLRCTMNIVNWPCNLKFQNVYSNSAKSLVWARTEPRKSSNIGRKKDHFSAGSSWWTWKWSELKLLSSAPDSYVSYPLPIRPKVKENRRRRPGRKPVASDLQPTNRIRWIDLASIRNPITLPRSVLTNKLNSWESINMFELLLKDHWNCRCGLQSDWISAVCRENWPIPSYYL